MSACRAEKELRERELRLYASHVALLSVLRSWPGFLHFCNPCQTSGLRALVDVLYLKQLEIRVCIHDIDYLFLIDDGTVITMTSSFLCRKLF